MIKIPKNATEKQIDNYNKNMLLRMKASENINKCGTLLGLCCDLGIQDNIDEDRFINHYPYHPFWVTLASIKNELNT